IGRCSYRRTERPTVFVARTCVVSPSYALLYSGHHSPQKLIVPPYSARTGTQLVNAWHSGQAIPRGCIPCVGMVMVSSVSSMFAPDASSVSGAGADCSPPHTGQKCAPAGTGSVQWTQGISSIFHCSHFSASTMRIRSSETPRPHFVQVYIVCSTHNPPHSLCRATRRPPLLAFSDFSSATYRAFIANCGESKSYWFARDLLYF